MRPLALAATCLLLATPALLAPSAALPLASPVWDPTVVTIVQARAGAVPDVYAPPHCFVNATASYGWVSCGTSVRPPQNVPVHPTCNWPQVSVTATRGTVEGTSRCKSNLVEAFASATATGGVPATATDVEMRNDFFPWICIGDFRAAGATGVVQCERGTDP